jgi:hypothetical protein
MDKKESKKQERLTKIKRNWKEGFIDATLGTGKKTQGRSVPESEVSKKKELEGITSEIIIDLDRIDRILTHLEQKEKEYLALQRAIIKKLIYIKDNEKRLLNKMNFIDYLEKDQRALELLDNFLDQVQ